MLTLAIEISNPSSAIEGSASKPGVAIARSEVGSQTIVGVEPVDLSKRSEEDLIPAIDRLCRRLEITPRSITRYAVSAGPGGYTALRLAVVTAKLLAEASHGSCIAVPTSHVAAFRAEKGQPFAVALQSKADAAFVTFFDAQGRATGEGSLLTAEQFATESQPRGIKLLIADRFLPAAIRAAADAAGIAIAPPQLDPVALLHAAVGLPEVAPMDLVPLYAREPEAVTKWRQLHGS
jgi:tRNA threonylcarbamoyl adenosine modification protein YeaZ